MMERNRSPSIKRSDTSTKAEEVPIFRTEETRKEHWRGSANAKELGINLVA